VIFQRKKEEVKRSIYNKIMLLARSKVSALNDESVDVETADVIMTKTKSSNETDHDCNSTDDEFDDGNDDSSDEDEKEVNDDDRNNDFHHSGVKGDECAGANGRRSEEIANISR